MVLPGPQKTPVTPAPGWTAEALETVFRCWIIEGLSTGAILAVLARDHKMRTTRNAVLGQINRRGWSRSGAPAAPGHKIRHRQAKAARSAATRKPAKKADLPPPALAGFQDWRALFPVTPAAVGIESLRATTCRWPVGEGKGLNQKFCGATPAGATPYCPGHGLRAYQPRLDCREPRAPMLNDSVPARADDALRDLTEVLG